jgi:hypothetical protein
MDQRLIEILKKAKAVDQRAKDFDTVDRSSTTGVSNQTTPGLTEMMQRTEPKQQIRKTIQPGTDIYTQRIKESKLPPEIQRAMLDNPIQQPDSPGTFSMNEEMIKEINPGYGMDNYSEDDEQDFTPQRRVIREVNTPTQSGLNENVIRKMIAEEIAKALPSIVEKYFDKKMIQENIDVLKSLKIRRKTNNTK